MDPQAGMILEGKVTSITNFGAFVTLENHRSGLVHISEIANTYVNDVHDFLEEGQTVKVLVLSTDNGKINLSIKKTLPRNDSGPRRNTPGTGTTGVSAETSPSKSVSSPRPAASVRPPRESTLPPSGDPSFEDKLKRFLSSSEGKMADLNRSIDGKRGGRRRR